MSKKQTSAFLFFLSVLTAVSFACSAKGSSTTEMLIAIRNENIPSLIEPGNPDPTNTGIPSLDDLNRQWEVQQMIAVYPDVSPDDEVAAKYGLVGVFKLVVPKTTNLPAMIRAYEANPHIEYAELNAPVEIK